MTADNDTGSFTLLPINGGGGLIVSSNPASLPGQAVADVVSQYFAQGATAVLSLTTQEELLALKLSELPSICKSQGMQWWHAPIEDMGEPDDEFEQWWRAHHGAIHGLLNNGQVLVLHCWSGYGRSGTVAARILIERGMTPEEALTFVREHRPGTVETVGQERYVLGLIASL
ncbi:MAG: dual specificity protein phosphatase family protein [Burkholderiaceae bacterium]|nr:dual specificity protein phosphatase family protein [Burkholderiaceae bacterium]